VRYRHRLAIVIAVIEFLWDGWRRTPRCWAAWTAFAATTTEAVSERAARARLGAVPLGCAAVLRNAERFQGQVLEAVASLRHRCDGSSVTAEPVTSVDVTSADMLSELSQTLREARIELRFAEMKDPVKDKLRRFELLDRLGADIFYPTIGAAVDAYLSDFKVDWKP
jgi:MFS superfamily sulfate permease-like transporter